MTSGKHVYRNAFLIYNPRAGKLNRSGGQLFERITAALQAGGHHVTPVATTGPNTAAAQVRELLARSPDAILAAGGDGTLNEVANGMIGSQVPLGILPVGTANVLAVELKLGTKAVRAAERLAEMEPRRISVGRLQNAFNADGRHFLLMAGVGLDAQIVYRVDAAVKAKFGKGAYWLAGFGQVFKMFPGFDVILKGSKTECSFALASRVRNYGGDLTIARGASLLSPQFETILFTGSNGLIYLKHFFGVLTGLLGRLGGVVVTQSSSARFEAASDPRIYIQIDGEYAGKLPAQIDIVPDALTLLMPPAFLR